MVGKLEASGYGLSNVHSLYQPGWTERNHIVRIGSVPAEKQTSYLLNISPGVTSRPTCSVFGCQQSYMLCSTQQYMSNHISSLHDQEDLSLMKNSRENILWFLFPKGRLMLIVFQFHVHWETGVPHRTSQASVHNSPANEYDCVDQTSRCTEFSLISTDEAYY